MKAGQEWPVGFGDNDVQGGAVGEWTVVKEFSPWHWLRTAGWLEGIRRTDERVLMAGLSAMLEDVTHCNVHGRDVFFLQ